MNGQELKMLQALPLDIKVAKSKLRIEEFVRYYGVSGVYISFSGGKDSTVLLDIVRSLYPNIPAVYIDTGLEYPSVKKFIKTKENVITLRPKIGFKEVITKYGYPVISKEQSQYISEYRNAKSEKLKSIRLNGKNGTNLGKISNKWKYLINADFKISEKCCKVMKKEPVKKYEHETGRVPIIGTLANESIQRKRDYYKNGCNSFDLKRPKSTPLGFWTEQDILNYILINKLDIAPVYGEIINDDGNLKTTLCERTGCLFCAYGCETKNDPRFKLLKQIEPQLFNYCMNGGEYNSEGMWTPNKEGLGLAYILEKIKVNPNGENNNEVEGQLTIKDFGL